MLVTVGLFEIPLAGGISNTKISGRRKRLVLPRVQTNRRLSTF